MSDSATESIRLEILGEEVELLAGKALHWPRQQLLAVADLHWGKSETFRIHGIPIPPGMMTRELGRLADLVRKTGASRVLVLGDLIHAVKGLTPDVMDEVMKWTKSLPARITLVRGNHDRSLSASTLEAWGIEAVTAPYLLEPFVFVHEPDTSELKGLPKGQAFYAWAGHLHPTVELSGKSDFLRLDCFHIGKKVAVLPAFSGFTRGIRVRPREGDRVFAVLPESEGGQASGGSGLIEI